MTLQLTLWFLSFILAFDLNALADAADNPAADDRFTPAEPITEKELFGQTIRATDLRSPADELAGFHVPEGFRVELVASEPAISKPMNMAFDVAGRLWITQSTQYPFPAKADEKGSDSVMVLEDKDNDGSFETTRVFADGLNIPIGLLPYGDGVLCFSIPNIYYLRDTDHNGVCDAREVVLGPFDTSRDTHGMINSMRMGTDGWVYACHGFNNQSKVQGTDGHSISLTSGNVFRFKPDGSRVELFTQGQVNPFGMAQDKWGFWYAADCHSKPISQLIRGGCYPSFGRPDDGLGFVPPMMEHLHGSTAISGLAHTKDSRFPQAFEDDFLSGNVMTCRINRNHLTYQGATAKANVMTDLLTSDDPCFRPVDLQFGPDGCLYVADFYNKVIGHYEVPLDHPDRDRTSGRIWRIRWVGGGDTIQRGMANAIPNSPAMLNYRRYEKLGATQEGEPSELLRQLESADSVNDPILVQSILIATRDILSRIRLRSETEYEQAITKLCRNGALEVTNPSRPFSIDARYVRSLCRVLLSLKDAKAVGGVLTLCEKQHATLNTSADQHRTLDEMILLIADIVEEGNMDRFIALLDSNTTDADARVDLMLKMAKRQLQQRGKILEGLRSNCRNMIGNLASKWQTRTESLAERSNPFQLVYWFGKSSTNDDRKNWVTEKREMAKAKNSAPEPGMFFSSFGLGESYIGTWSSSPFIAKDKLDFYIVGHNGLPSKEVVARNFVSLVKLDRTGNVEKELFRALPPRSDLGQKVQWDLQLEKGATVQLRVVDGDSSASYAWIGIGESSTTGLNPGPIRDQWDRIVSILSICGLPTKPEGLEELGWFMRSRNSDWNSQLYLHRFGNKHAHAEVVELFDFVTEQNWTDLFALAGIDVSKSPHWDWGAFEQATLLKLGDAVCKRCSYQDQERLILRLAKHRGAIKLVAALCEQGSLSRDALRVLPTSWWDGLPDESRQKLESLRPEATASSNRLAVVESKAVSLESLAVDQAVGAKQFADRCAICHKLGEQGKVVGPQLEGVGARGVMRLCEDILWPDRNVDEAFKMTIIILDSDESISGLVTDRTAESLLLTDQNGKQRRILLSEIEQEKPSKLSLMPGNFDELMTDSELASLIGFLRNAASSPQSPPR